VQQHRRARADWSAPSALSADVDAGQPGPQLREVFLAQRHVLHAETRQMGQPLGELEGVDRERPLLEVEVFQPLQPWAGPRR
jgi:hypothetical protein